MIVYFDTSALVKRYLVEEGSLVVEALWNETSRAVASEILYDEMAATFARKACAPDAFPKDATSARTRACTKRSIARGYSRAPRRAPRSHPRLAAAAGHEGALARRLPPRSGEEAAGVTAL